MKVTRKVKFTQREEIIQPDQLRDALSQYWSRFWMREDFEEQFDPVSWGPFLEQLPTLPAPALESQRFNATISSIGR